MTRIVPITNPLSHTRNLGYRWFRYIYWRCESSNIFMKRELLKVSWKSKKKKKKDLGNSSLYVPFPKSFSPLSIASDRWKCVSISSFLSVWRIGIRWLILLDYGWSLVSFHLNMLSFIFCQVQLVIKNQSPWHQCVTEWKIGKIYYQQPNFLIKGWDNLKLRGGKDISRISPHGCLSIEEPYIKWLVSFKDTQEMEFLPSQYLHPWLMSPFPS